MFRLRSISSTAILRHGVKTGTMFSPKQLQQQHPSQLTRLFSSNIVSQTTTTAATAAATSVADNLTSAPVVETAALSALSVDPPISSLNFLYPSEVVIGVIQTIHEQTGLPWWASIMLNTFIIRGALLPLIRQQQWAAYRMVQAQPDILAVSESFKTDNTLTPDEKAARMRQVFSKHNVTPFSMFKVAIVQFPVFISCFIGLKQMAETHHTLSTGGLFWFTDLTAPDTTYVLPAAMTVLNIAILRLGDGQPQHEQMKIVKNVFSGAMLLFFPFVMSFPTLFFMHWGTMSTLSLVQSVVLRSNAARSVLGLPPKMTHTPKPLWGGSDSAVPFPSPLKAPSASMEMIEPTAAPASRPRSRRARR